MMRRRRARGRRRLKGAGVAGTLLAGVVITVTASPALAATGITSPSPGATITGGSSVLVEAEVDGLLSSGKLQLRGPTDDGFSTVASGHGTLSYRLQLGGTEPARNGEYTVRLDAGTLILRSTQGKRSFTVRVAPRQPSGLVARARSDRQVRLQWHRGAEPDLVSYDVLTTSGRTLRDGLSVDRICGSSLCTANVTLAPSAEGEVGLAVRAHRRTAPGSSKTVASDRSRVDTVTLAGSPSPSPSVSASGSSPSVQASGEASLTAQPELEPLSSSSPSKEPNESPLALSPVVPGGDKQDPGFSAPLAQLPTETPPAGGEASGPGTSWTALTSAAQRWKTAAIVVILLLVAAHLSGVHRRGGRSRRPSGRPGRGDGGQPATAMTATGPTYANASGASTTRLARHRGAQPLRRVRSLLGAYRGRRRRFD